MRRALFVVASATAGVVLPLSAAHADDTVVVRGLGFAPDSATNLAIVGCSGLYAADAGGVTTYLSPSPDGPAGSRALKYQLAGGTAVGSQHHVDSMVATTAAGLSVLAPHGTTGVAYAVFRDPQDAGGTVAWVGQAPLSVDAGSWQRVEATGLTYSWSRYDLATGQPAVGAATPDGATPAGTGQDVSGQAAGADDGPATVATFLADHGGDAAGLYAVGLGCDGSPFKIDALQTGSAGDVTTYDLEGYTTTTGISGSATRVRAGDPVTLQGSVSSEQVGPPAQGLLVLEAQQPGHGFVPVDGATMQLSGSGVSATVEPTAHTVYRWRFGGSASADGSVSAPFVVDVASAVTAQPDPGAAGADTAGAVVGHTLPGRAGARVTLWRLAKGGPVAVSSARTTADGAYSLEVPAEQAGNWRYYVAVPAGGGNLAGRSPVQKFSSPKAAQ